MRPGNKLECADGKKTSTGHSRSQRVKKSFRMINAQEATVPKIYPRLSPLRRRQQQFGPQSPDRRPAQGKTAAIETGEIDHNRQAEAGTRLGLVKPLAPAGHLGPLFLRKAAPIVVDQNSQHRRLAGLSALLG